VELVDERYSIGLDEVKDPDERAVIICTEPLTNEARWIKMKSGQLIKAHKGSVRIV